MTSLPNPTPQTLSQSLTDAASGFDESAALHIADGNPEAAVTASRLAGHLRRLAFNHSAAAEYQDDPSLDPEQIG